MRLKNQTLIFATLLAAASVGSAAYGGEAPVYSNRPTTITGIPGVVAAGSKWQLVDTSLDLQDGIIGTADGGLLISHMETNIVQKLEPNGAFSMLAGGLPGAGGLSQDKDGGVYAVLREGVTSVVKLYPDRRVLATALPDGKPIPRPNDLVVDAKGGVYVASAPGVWYVNPQGVVSTVVDQNFRGNGITLSTDGKVLYASNDAEIDAWDVHPDGSTSNRRVFATLDGDTGGDGMTVDSANRLYETGVAGIHVYAPDGRHLGMIQTQRRPTAVAFSGPGKKTLYVIMMGAAKSDGGVLSAAEGGKLLSRSLYKMPALATGWKGWPK